MLAWRSLPVRLAATLAAGLPQDSRSFRTLSGEPVPTAQLLQASVADSLHRLEWRICGCQGPAPASLVQAMLGTQPKLADTDVQSFDTPAAFEAALRAVEGGEKTHGD